MRCKCCDSDNIKLNGINKYGSQQYCCHDCGAAGVLHKRAERERKQRLRAYALAVAANGIRRSTESD